MKREKCIYCDKADPKPELMHLLGPLHLECRQKMVNALPEDLKRAARKRGQLG